MIRPDHELRRFLHAALVAPVERDHRESDAAFRRRRIVAVVTLLVGAAVLAWALRIEPGDPVFYLATFALAGVWTAGAVASGRLHVGRGHTRAGGAAIPVVQSLALGLLLLAAFLAGALVVARIPLLRGPVDGLLDHARLGSLPLVLVITVVNGIAEELYFRGALFAAVGTRWPVRTTTVVYALVTAASGVALLTFAALVLGWVTGLQRRVTGGVLAPVITHLTWSVGMLVLLPIVLDLAG
jgi:membrane protease YdiL (CAAX protease family)